MRYLYLCCIYYLFVTLQFFWDKFDSAILRLFNGNNLERGFCIFSILAILFITASFVSVVLSWKAKRWWPVLIHQGVFWGLFTTVWYSSPY